MDVVCNGLETETAFPVGGGRPVRAGLGLVWNRVAKWWLDICYYFFLMWATMGNPSDIIPLWDIWFLLLDMLNV